MITLLYAINYIKNREKILYYNFFNFQCSHNESRTKKSFTKISRVKITNL